MATPLVAHAALAPGVGEALVQRMWVVAEARPLLTLAPVLLLLLFLLWRCLAPMSTVSWLTEGLWEEIWLLGSL